MHSKDLQAVYWTMIDRGHTATEIASCLQVGRATLYRWRKKGRGASRALLNRAPRKLTASLTTALQQQFESENTTTLTRGAELLWTTFGIRVTRMTISRFLERAGITCKKASKRYAEMSQERAADFLHRASSTFGPETYVLDEAAFFMNHIRAYAWSKLGQRAIVKRPGIRGKAHSLLLCISSTGVFFWELYEGAVTAVRFSELLNRLPHGGRVVLDNAQIHRATNVLKRQQLPTIPDIARSRQLTMAYLPPYAPLLNPVELCFNAVRTHVRRDAPRDAVSLRSSVERAISHLTPSVCASTIGKVWSPVADVH